ncbi:hypothetical protein HMPREF9372_0775 [Sporosarcina newyorkensis 2681]|uniref:Uncharacterized protein n=1 Tax=Sporosarcina newyorkensis 2681 TaxID=1027292 RepID=F9DPP5_9BACL|nr:hypothetical protein HMPREF9372_0775 [Sporosarcina newyorkensis 2681]
MEFKINKRKLGLRYRICAPNGDIFRRGWLELIEQRRVRFVKLLCFFAEFLQHILLTLCSVQGHKKNADPPEVAPSSAPILTSNVEAYSYLTGFFLKI